MYFLSSWFTFSSSHIKPWIFYRQNATVKLSYSLLRENTQQEGRKIALRNYLHPLKVADNHSSRIGKNIRQHNNSLLLEHLQHHGCLVPSRDHRRGKLCYKSDFKINTLTSSADGSVG